MTTYEETTGALYVYDEEMTNALTTEYELDTRDYPHTTQELFSGECDTCFRNPINGCQCYTYSKEILIMGEILADWVLEHGTSAMPHGDRKYPPWVVEWFNALVSEERPGKVIGFSRASRFGKVRIYMYGEDMPKYNIKRQFDTYAECVLFIIENIYMFECQFKTVAKKPKENERRKATWKCAPEIRSEVGAPKVNIWKLKTKPIKKTDYDRQTFEHCYNTYASSKINRGMKAPDSMKMEFALEKIAKLKEHDLDFKPPMSPSYRINQHDGADPVVKLDIMDEILYIIYLHRVTNGTYEGMEKKLKFFTLDANILGDVRKEMFHIALLQNHKDKTLPRIPAEVVDPYQRRHYRQPENVSSITTGTTVPQVLAMNLPAYHEYRIFVKNWMMFRSVMRKKLGYSVAQPQYAANLRNIAIWYVKHCTNEELVATVFSGLANTNSSIGKAAENLAGLDVEAINDAILKLSTLATKGTVTADNIARLFSEENSTAASHIVQGMDDIFTNPTSILQGMSGFINDSIQSQLTSFLGKHPILDKVLKEITITKLITLTICYVLFNHSESTVVRTMIVYYVLQQFGLIQFVMDHVNIFVDAVMQAAQAFYNKWIPTSIFSAATSLVSCFSSGFCALLAGFVAIMAAVSKCKISFKMIKKIITLTAGFGRDIHFMNAGLNALPNLLAHFKSAMTLTWAWITGKTKPMDAVAKVKNDINAWSHNVYMYGSPSLLDVLRTNKSMRDLARPLYDEGVKLYKTVTTTPGCENLVVRVTTELRVAKKIVEHVTRFEDNAVERPTPYHIVLESQPGIGKTNMTHVIARKFRDFYWKERDMNTLMYNVPVNNEYFDNYAKQPIMILDDYNMINDPLIASKIIYLISNLPMILPMANLEDKGMINASEVVISTTNNAYTVANGINCHDAFNRRRQHVANITVPDECMSNGNLNENAIKKYYLEKVFKSRMSSVTFRNNVEQDIVKSTGFTIEDLKRDGRYENKLYEVAQDRAQDYYEQGDFYTFVLNTPKINKQMLGKDGNPLIFDQQGYLEYIIADFAAYREQQARILSTGDALYINQENLMNLVHVKTEVEKRIKEAEALKATITAHTTPTTEQAEMLHGLPSWIAYAKTLKTNISNCVINMTGVEGVADAFKTANIVEEVLDETVKQQLDELLKEEEEKEEEEELEIPNIPLSALPGMSWFPTNEYFTHRLEQDNKHIIQLNNLEEVYLPDAENLAQIEESAYSEDPPRFGWYPQQQYLDGDVNVPLATKVSNDFIMRLFTWEDDYLVANTDIEIDDLDVDVQFSKRSYCLVYAEEESGLIEYHRNAKHMYESIATFHALSNRDRLRLALVGREIAAVVSDINDLASTTPTRAAVPTTENNTTFFQKALNILGKVVTTAIIYAMCSLIYIILYCLVLRTVGWLLAPTPTNTVYNVQPKKGTAGTGLAWYKTGSEQTIKEQRKRYLKNMGVAYVSKEDWFSTREAKVNFTYLKANVALFPRHFFTNILVDGQESVVVRTTTVEGPEQENIVTKRDIYDFENTDAVLVILRSGTNRYKDLTKLFLKEAHLQCLQSTQVILHQREVETGCVLAGRSDVIEMTDITLGTESTRQLRSIVYNNSVERGTSGGLAMIVSNAFPTTIVGCQSASTAHWGCTSVVTQEMLNEALAKLQPFEYELLSSEFTEVFEPTQLEHIKLQDTPIFDIFDHPDITAIAPKEEIPHLATKTDLHRTPIANVLPSNGREPAILHDFDRRREKFSDKPHYLKKSVNKFCADMMQPLTYDEMEECAEGHVQMYQNSKEFNNLKIRSFEESLTGLPLPGYRKMNTNTSPGLPWVLPAYHQRVSKGKKDFFLFNEQGELEFTNPILREAVEDLRDKLSRRIIPNLRMMDTLKDELRDATLGKENTTRIVTVLPMQINILFRMYNMDLWAGLHRLASKAYPISVGINIYSHHAQLMMRKLQSLDGGRFCFDFDISNWDGHMAPDYFRMLVDVESAMYQDSPRDKIVRQGLYEYIQFGFEQLGPIIIKKYRGMPSGTAGTAENNSRAHSKLLYIAYRRIMLREGRPDLKSFDSFLCNVVYYVYGDDIIVSVRESIIKLFNGITVAQEYAKLGWPATPAVKGNEHVKFKHWSEIVFLKHKFVESFDGFTLALIDEATIQNLFLWMRGKNKEQFYQNLLDAFRFLAMYEKPRFDHYLKICNTALKHNYMRQINYRWHDMRALVLADYYN